MNRSEKNAIAQGSNEFFGDSVWPNTRKLIIGLINQISVNGSYMVNQFNFEHFIIKEVVFSSMEKVFLKHH